MELRKMSEGRVKVPALSDLQFHKRIIDRHSMGRRKYTGSPALVYKKVSRSLITFKNRVCVTVPTIKLILTGTVPKQVTGIAALKNRTDCAGDVSSSSLYANTLPLRTSPVIDGTRAIYASKTMEAASSKAVQRRTRSSAERPDRSLAENHYRGAYFRENGLSLIPPFSLSELNTSGRSFPVRRYRQDDPAYPSGTGQYQNNAAYRSNSAFSISGMTNVPGADKELYLHSPFEMEHLIRRNLMEIRKSMAVTRETVMAQSAAVYSQIEKDLRHQFSTEKISENVYRQIERRLKIEYERRGII